MLREAEERIRLQKAEQERQKVKEQVQEEIRL
jgi:hypothetical protein